MLKQEQIKHRPLKIEVGSGAMAEIAFSSDRSHPPFAFYCNQENVQFRVISFLKGIVTSFHLGILDLVLQCYLVDLICNPPSLPRIKSQEYPKFAAITGILSKSIKCEHSFGCKLQLFHISDEMLSFISFSKILRGFQITVIQFTVITVRIISLLRVWH